MKRFLRSFGFAANGLKYSFLTQPNFKIHSACSVLAAVLGFACNITTGEWLWLLFAIALVLIAEMVNTALETLVDLVSPDYHPKAGIVKDVSAGAVLIAAIFALCVGLLIFVPRLM